MGMIDNADSMREKVPEPVVAALTADTLYA
jgi:hypothetical protein